MQFYENPHHLTLKRILNPVVLLALPSQSWSPKPSHAVLLVLSAGLAGTPLYYQPDKPYKHFFN